MLCGRGACHPCKTNRLREGNSDAKTNTRDGCSRPLAPNNSAMHSFPLLNKFLHLNLAFQQQQVRFCGCNSLPTHVICMIGNVPSQSGSCMSTSGYTRYYCQTQHHHAKSYLEENCQGQCGPGPVKKAGRHCSHSIKLKKLVHTVHIVSS